MDIDIIAIVIIMIFAGLAWYANETLNKVPTLKQIVSVLIILIAVLYLFGALGLSSHFDKHLRVN